MPLGLLLLVFLLAGSAPAEAKPTTSGPTELVARGSALPRTLKSDGRRWALWVDGARLRAYDDLRGRSFAVPGARECADASQDAAIAGVTMSRGGVGLVGCEYVLRFPDGSFEEGIAHDVFNPRTRRARPLPGALPHDSFDRIGARWAEGTTNSGPDSRDTLTVLVDWRTGERVETADECYDLDRTRPVVIRSRDAPCFYRDAHQQEDGFRLWMVDGDRDRINLFRGRRFLHRLNDRDCGWVSLYSMQLGGGWATAARPRGNGTMEVVAYDIAARRASAWRIGGLARRRADVAHTKRRLLVAVPDGKRFRVLIGRRP